MRNRPEQRRASALVIGAMALVETVGASGHPPLDDRAPWRDAAPSLLVSDTTVASAVVLGPMSASSPDGRLAVTVCATISAGEQPRSAHALIEARGALATWTRLPFDELPETIAVSGPDRIVFGIRGPSGGVRLVTIDAQGRLLGGWSLASHLPLHTSAAAAGLGWSGESFIVPLECGSVATVELDATGYDICSWIPAPRLACGVDAWLEQSRILLRDGDDAAALFALESAREAGPDDARTYRALAQFHRRTGDSAARLACLQEGMERLHASANGACDSSWRVGTPEARLALEFVETVREVKGDDHAHAALDEALALYPCMQQAVLLRAELELASGRPEGAIQSLRHVLASLEADTDAAVAHHDVGRFLERAGRREDAIEFLRDAHALGDTSEFLFRGLADLHEAGGEFEQAAEWLERLALRWSDVQNGESDAERSRRALERLSELELEIAELHRRASLARAAPPDDQD